MATSYDHTKEVHDRLKENLAKETERLNTLLAYESDVALQIEDAHRVILAIRRSIATLKAGIPAEHAAPTQTPEPTTLREVLVNADRASRNENYDFTSEEAERRYEQAVASASE